MSATQALNGLVTETTKKFPTPSMNDIFRQLDESYYHLGYIAHQIGSAVGRYRTELASAIKPLCLDLEKSQQSTTQAYQILVQSHQAIACERDELSRQLQAINASEQQRSQHLPGVFPVDDARDCVYIHDEDQRLNEDSLTDASLISLPDSDDDDDVGCDDHGGTDEDDDLGDTLQTWIKREAAESARISMEEPHKSTDDMLATSHVSKLGQKTGVKRLPSSSTVQIQPEYTSTATVGLECGRNKRKRID